ncbi:MAG: GNAT family N-acetyltransferase, partial [bacterium]|nr:GNAT family N-acetyltransferase [bacterium]
MTPRNELSPDLSAQPIFKEEDLPSLVPTLNLEMAGVATKELGMCALPAARDYHSESVRQRFMLVQRDAFEKETVLQSWYKDLEDPYYWVKIVNLARKRALELTVLSPRDEIIVFLELATIGNSLGLPYLSVQASLQGKQIGRELVEKLEDLAKRKGFKSLVTQAKNARSERFFRNCGWTP